MRRCRKDRTIIALQSGQPMIDIGIMVGPQLRRQRRPDAEDAAPSRPPAPPREPKLQVSFWGLRISAEGSVAVLPALLIYFAVLVTYRF